MYYFHVLFLLKIWNKESVLFKNFNFTNNEINKIEKSLFPLHFFSQFILVNFAVYKLENWYKIILFSEFGPIVIVRNISIFFFSYEKCEKNTIFTLGKRE